MNELNGLQTNPPRAASASAGAPRAAGLRRPVATLGLLLLLLAPLLLAAPGLHDVLGRIGNMSGGWLIAAVALELASCLSFVVVFRLFFADVPPRRARGLPWTQLASSALLTGGVVAGLAIGGWLLHLAGVPTQRVVQSSSALFFLHSAVNLVAVAAAGLLLASGIAAGPHDLLRAGLPILGAVALTAVVLIVARRSGGRGRVPRWRANVLRGMRGARHAIALPSWRMTGVVGFLAFDIAVLWATLAALVHAPPAAALVLAYIVGSLANLVPIPGGIGVLDAGLAAALVAYGMPATDVGAAVLVYHAIAFWIPGAGGLLAYIRLRRRLVQGTPAA